MNGREALGGDALLEHLLAQPALKNMGLLQLGRKSSLNGVWAMASIGGEFIALFGLVVIGASEGRAKKNGCQGLPGVTRSYQGGGNCTQQNRPLRLKSQGWKPIDAEKQSAT